MCVCVCRGPVWEEICSLGPTPAHCRPSGAEDEVQRPGSTLAPKNLQVLQGLGVWFDQPGLVFAEHLDFGVLPDGPPGSDCCLQSRTGSWHSLLQCCNACSWTHLSSSSKIQRNCMGLKITVCMGRWGKYLNPKDTKRPKNPTATVDEPGAKAGYCACLLHSIPLKGGGKIPKATLSARPLDTPLCCA